MKLSNLSETQIRRRALIALPIAIMMLWVSIISAGTASAQTFDPKTNTITFMTVDDVTRLGEKRHSSGEMDDAVVVSRGGKFYETTWWNIDLSSPLFSSGRDQTDKLSNEIVVPVNGKYTVYPFGLVVDNGVLVSTPPVIFGNQDVAWQLPGSDQIPALKLPSKIEGSEWRSNDTWKLIQYTGYMDEASLTTFAWGFIPQRDGGNVIIDVLFGQVGQLRPSTRNIPMSAPVLIGRNPLSINWTTGEKVQIISSSWSYSEWGPPKEASGINTPGWKLFHAVWNGALLKRLATNEVILDRSYDFFYNIPPQADGRKWGFGTNNPYPFMNGAIFQVNGCCGTPLTTIHLDWLEPKTGQGTS